MFKFSVYILISVETENIVLPCNLRRFRIHISFALGMQWLPYLIYVSLTSCCEIMLVLFVVLHLVFYVLIRFTGNVIVDYA